MSLIHLILLFVLKGVDQSDADTDVLAVEEESGPEFGLILGLGGLGDKSYNDLLYRGMVLAKKEFNISYIYDVPETADSYKSIMEKQINAGCNVIIASSYELRELVEIYAEKYLCEWIKLFW